MTIEYKTLVQMADNLLKTISDIVFDEKLQYLYSNLAGVSSFSLEIDISYLGSFE